MDSGVPAQGPGGDGTLLPSGFRLQLDPDTRRPRRTVLVGGTPVRVLRLTEAGARLVDLWSGRTPVGSARAERRLARRLVESGIAHPRPPASAGPGDVVVPRVAVVVPVRDDPVGLRSTLASLPGDMQTVVVDDGSLEPVDGGQVLRRRVAGGPAAARNTGWRQVASGLRAEHDVVLFVDAGVTLAPGALEAVLPHFADPTVAAVAPRVRCPGGPGTVASFQASRSSLDMGPREAVVRPGSRVAYLPTACLAVRVRALEGIGGFDEALRWGEDVDLVWRLVDAGWSVRYEPGGTVQHQPREGLAALARQRFDYGRSAAALAERHGPKVAPLAVSAWSAGAWALVLAGFPGAGAALMGGTAAALARRAGNDAPTARALAALALRGNLQAGRWIAAAVRTAWLPPALAATAALSAASGSSPFARRSRRWVAASLAATFALPAFDSSGDRGALNRATWWGLSVADDLAYQAGVWAGAAARRSGRALLPRFS